VTTIAELRRLVAARMKKLQVYDLFLRDRSVLEWFKDNSFVVHWLIRNGQSRQYHEESHAFWTHLSDAEKRDLVANWLKLVEHGQRLLGDARQGGIGIGYGPAEPAPPKRADEVRAWAHDADVFIQKMEGTRQRKRIETRIDPHPSLDIAGPLKTLSTIVVVGVGGLLLVSILRMTRG